MIAFGVATAMLYIYSIIWIIQRHFVCMFEQFLKLWYESWMFVRRDLMALERFRKNIT